MINIEAEIKASEAKLIDAIRRADADALASLLHDNLLFNLPSGETKTKAFDLETYRSGKMVVNSIAATDLEINAIDAQTAVVAVTVALNAKWYDNVVDGNFRYLRVWKAFDGDWKVIAGSVVPFTL